jgi:MFS transporter, DHA2 family, multidrug resistance protein
VSATPALARPVTSEPPRIAPALSRLAAALPADLSDSPLLGIAGVILGAGIVTLAGRLLSLGLGDLKGNVGLGVDEGAWIGSAFNVALMFIGPLTVYFGAMLGTRPVLLVCAGVFTLVSLYLPLVHSYSLMMVLLAIAGLTAGTFYPLTLSFALRSIPLRYLALTLAVYALCIEGAVNFAPSLYGFQRDHLSWRWMFWTSAIVTPVMMACIYAGIPRSPRPARSGPTPSFIGFFYASAGLALLFAALDQGQRLDWWRSGLFTALFVVGTFLLLCALGRRLRAPNPLVDLPYLRKWNTVILGFGLYAFRFCLLATIVIIPQSLSVRGLDAAQFGPAVLWTAVAELSLAVVAARLLNKGIDSRLLLALGFAMIAFACVVNADYTSAWAAENYFRSALLMGVGQIFAMVGLVGTIVLQAMFSGGLDSPYRALTFSAFFHVVRLFGGQVGVALMGHYIAEREKVHSFLIGLHVQPGALMTAETVKDLAGGLVAKSTGAPAAAGRAIGVVAGSVRLQAYALSYIDAFHFIAWTCVAALLLVAMLRRLPMNFLDLVASGRDVPQPRKG